MSCATCYWRLFVARQYDEVDGWLPAVLLCTHPKRTGQELKRCEHYWHKHHGAFPVPRDLRRKTCSVRLAC